MKEAIEKLVQKLVRIDSTQGKTKEVVLVYQSFLEENGFSTNIDEYSPDKVNLETRIGPKNTPELIISGHLDVVPIGNIKDWEYDPFSGKIIDGELWGRGSVDMKGGTGCLAGVIVELLKHEDKLNQQIVLAVTAEEEIGLNGARRFAEKGIMKNASHLLIAEPTGLGVAILEKGVLWADVIAKGKQAHGSRPDLGHNAIEGIAQLLPDLYSVLPDNSIPEVGKSTLNIGVINGGTVPNVVPEEATVKCDYRLTPGVSVKSVQDKLENLLEQKSSAEIKYSLFAEPALSAEPVITPDRSFAENIAKHTKKLTGINVELSGMYYATDGAVLMEAKEVPFAIFGPGSTELLHQTNERLDLRELDIARKVILNTILDIATK